MDLAAYGYTQQEFFFGGTATAYSQVGTPSADGNWTATPSATAPYKVRMLVRRPVSPEKFNGTVVVEWLNVTPGIEWEPQWIYMHDEMLRQGYAYVGISAQRAGVNFLRARPSGRYSTLTHPGDDYSYDIFSQAAEALRSPNGLSPLGDLLPYAQRYLAAGQSQSANRLVTYVDAVQPLVHAYNGFFIHSRLSAAPLEQAVPVPAEARIRTDVDVPVFVFETETDVAPSSITGQEGQQPAFLARQADSDHFRLWEVAGTAHLDLYGDTIAHTIPPFLPCTGPDPAYAVPVNDGPMTWVARAALHNLDAWVHYGIAPPVGQRLEMSTSTPANIKRDDATGIALGGVRTPQVDVPTRTITGERGAAFGGTTFGCSFLGRTDPWNGGTDPWDGGLADPSPTPEPDLHVLYPEHGAYVSAFAHATGAAVRGGFLLPVDGETLVETAASSSVGK